MVNMTMLRIEYNRICQPFYFSTAVRIRFVRIVIKYDIEFVSATVECAPHNLTGLYLTVNHNHILAKINHKYKDKDFYIAFIASCYCNFNIVMQLLFIFVVETSYNTKLSEYETGRKGSEKDRPDV